VNVVRTNFVPARLIRDRYSARKRVRTYGARNSENACRRDEQKKNSTIRRRVGRRFRKTILFVLDKHAFRDEITFPISLLSHDNIYRTRRISSVPLPTHFSRSFSVQEVKSSLANRAADRTQTRSYEWCTQRRVFCSAVAHELSSRFFRPTRFVRGRPVSIVRRSERCYSHGSSGTKSSVIKRITRLLV